MNIYHNPIKLNVNEPIILYQDRVSYYGKVTKIIFPDAVEFLPPNIPITLEVNAQINVFVDNSISRK